MELLIEIILELILEGSMEIIKIKTVPKFIRYPLIFLITLFFGGVILGIFAISFTIFKENFLAGTFILFTGIIFLISLIFRVNKVYQKNKENPSK